MMQQLQSCRLNKQADDFITEESGSNSVVACWMPRMSACKLQWFPNQDINDLLILAKEVMKTFSDPEYIRIEPTHASFWVSKVMSRFYPNMKMDQMLFSLELKPGLRFCVAGFPITRGTVSPKNEKVHLLVAQVHNLKTSSCIISPQEVNFLLNGQGVEGRTIESMDEGPQLPSNVTAKLKYGVNCLQAIGQFNYNYLVVIAVMSNTQSSNPPELQDYVRPIALTDSEAHTMAMSSRISLNCPISKSRIKTPVKGELCKHPQRFDYDNFLAINSKRPSWECPQCKQPVCYVDIRIDQNVVKVLSEAEEKVVNVIMSENGSWKEDKDHSAQIYGERQVRHQIQESRASTCGSTSLQNYNQTDSAARNSVPKQNIQSNVLGSAYSNEVSVNNDSHDNSGQLLQKDSSLDTQGSGAETCPIWPPFKQQNQQHWSLSNLNTSEALSNTENVVRGSVPAPEQPVERNATIRNPSAVHQAPHSPSGAPFPLTTPKTSSRLNSSEVVEEARRIRNEELQQVDVAAGDLADWRPTKRVRGSLTGEAYSAALQQFIIQPSLRAQALRLPSNAVSTRGPLTNALAARSASQKKIHRSLGDSTNP